MFFVRDFTEVRTAGKLTRVSLPPKLIYELWLVLTNVRYFVLVLLSFFPSLPSV